MHASGWLDTLLNDCRNAARRLRRSPGFALAAILVSAPELWDLRDRSDVSLIRFATAHGKPGLYHETITWAFMGWGVCAQN